MTAAVLDLLPVTQLHERHGTMQVSRTMSYAIHAVLLLERAAPGQLVSCPELAAKGDMPERFLLQILRSLVNYGVLDSVRGAEGGYLLARSPRRISLLDLFEALQDPLVTATPMPKDVPVRSRKTLRKAVDRVAAAARKELARISVAQLAGRGRAHARW